MSFNVFLIHYTKLRDRLGPALSTWNTLGVDPQIIGLFDGDQINIDSVGSSTALWSSRIHSIISVLKYNAGLLRFDGILLDQTCTDNCPPWASARELSIGEISVLLKHFLALSLIASGDDPFGIIAEDDVVCTAEAKLHLDTMFLLLDSHGIDYLDLAGGCNLVADLSEKHIGDGSYILLTKARTRTNACYVVSRSLAKRLVDKFLPACFPIDWHLQYLFEEVGDVKCAWFTKDCFIHGSETGLYKSWRSV